MLENSYIRQYIDQMEDIKMRIDVVDSWILKKNGFDWITIEFCALQMRKVIEIIMLSSLIVDKHNYEKVIGKIDKQWNAKKICNLLDKINPRFYPVPVETIGVAFVNVSRVYLQKEEMGIYYDKFGKLTHANNPYAREISLDTYVQNIIDCKNKIVSLLSCHLCHPINKEFFYYVTMNAGGTNEIQMTEFRRKD